MLDPDRLARELTSHADRFADLTAGAPPGTPVPTCPDWTLADLDRHVSGTLWWMTHVVATRATAPIRSRDVPGDPPRTRDGAAALVAAVREAGPEVPLWFWAGGRGTPTSWLRRMLFELVVHTADAELATGRPVQADAAEVGADGVDEWLTILPYVRPGLGAVLDGRTLHLHAVDGGEWLVRGAADGGLDREHGHAKGDVAVRAGAGSLHLLLNRRLSADDPRFAVHGDRALLDSFLGAAVF